MFQLRNFILNLNFLCFIALLKKWNTWLQKKKILFKEIEKNLLWKPTIESDDSIWNKWKDSKEIPEECRKAKEIGDQFFEEGHFLMVNSII